MKRSLSAQKQPDKSGVSKHFSRLEKLANAAKKEGSEVEFAAAMIEFLKLELNQTNYDALPGLGAFNWIFRAWSYWIHDPNPSEHYIRQSLEQAANSLLAYIRGETETL